VLLLGVEDDVLFVVEVNLHADVGFDRSIVGRQNGFARRSMFGYSLSVLSRFFFLLTETVSRASTATCRAVQLELVVIQS